MQEAVGSGSGGGGGGRGRVGQGRVVCGGVRQVVVRACR